MPVNIRRPSKSATGLTLGILSIIFLFFDFYSNTWRVAEPSWFKKNIRERECERLVLGRMAKTRQDGIFSAGGLLGLVSPDEKPRLWLDSPFEFGYAAYLKKQSIGAYTPYLSQAGGQGMFFSFLDTLIPLSPSIKLTLFHILVSLLTAIVLTLVVLWFYLEFGFLVAISVLVSMVFSQWLVVFGRNLFWSLWAFYVPMVVIMYLLRHDRTFTKHHAIKFTSLVFIGFLFKVFFTGYEYISTTLIMMVVPLLFYCVLDKHGLRWFFRYTFLAGFASGLAIFLSMVILCLQITSVQGMSLDGAYPVQRGFMNGVHHLLFALERRSYAKAGIFSGEYGANFPSLIQMLWIYLKGSFFDIPNYFNVQNPLLVKTFLKVSYLYLVLIFLVASCILRGQKFWTDPGIDGRRSKALVVSTWFSLLAPLSWFIIFKQHSAIHTHLNFIVWQMPFTIFGFALCGLVVSVFLHSLFRQTIRHT